MLLHQSNSQRPQNSYLVWKWTGLHTSTWENKFRAKLFLFRTSLLHFLGNRLIFYTCSQQNYNQKELFHTGSLAAAQNPFSGYNKDRLKVIRVYIQSCSYNFILPHLYLLTLHVISCQLDGCVKRTFQSVVRQVHC